mgnify:CR=1 FL=1|jgi:hypothetical protein|tara:strand:- start:157 stop:561 length:405 start_codon:yes stop_codon:yes gene_type:complete
MNNEVLKILLTESNVNLIMNALTFFASEFDNDGDGFTGALELHDDLLEQVARHDDPDWVIDREPTEIEEGFSFSVTEDDFIDAGIRAREQAKATSMAANRRTIRFGEFTVEDAGDRTEQQKVDIWDRPNDPTKW